MPRRRNDEEPKPRLPKYRDLNPRQTVAQVLRDEMLVRGHSQADAAREMSTSEANVSRWLNNRQTPDTAVTSQDNVAKLVSYLRLRTKKDYLTLYLNTQIATS